MKKLKLTITRSSKLKSLEDTAHQQKKEIQAVTGCVEAMLKSNTGWSVPETVTHPELRKALHSIQNHLTSISTKDAEQNWINVGIAKFADILRNKNSLDLPGLSNDIICNLVSYVGANQGGIFIYHDENRGDEHLELIACYAYNRKKFMNKRVNLGEGLAGQCVLEKEHIYIKKVPDHYISITSGLGEARPREVLIMPMCLDDNVYGVIELASFQEFTGNKIAFIKRLAESIASSIKTVRDNERVLSLLTASQQQSEELKAQEEEMRQNMEELQATQEEMERKSAELIRTSVEMNSLIRGINATMAVIEFTPGGKIITANANFLKATGYDLDGVFEKHHSMFVPADVRRSNEYQVFWKNLEEGTPTTGIFKRLAADGSLIWLNAIYNPVKDVDGRVIKVVKFAVDITRQEELLAESKGLMNGINETMVVAEFSPDGIIQHANDNFLSIMNCTLSRIEGKHHSIFVPEEERSSEMYQTFWTRLSEGESVKGEFKRVGYDGRIVWLNAIYNPITNANGDVTKVMKFGFDITSSTQVDLFLKDAYQ